MGASSNCKPWCAKRKDDGSWCWKCNGFADSCGGYQECKDNNCAPADCQGWCAGQFKKKSVSDVCAMTACAGCDKCPEPAVIKAAANYVCEDNKNYMGQAQEWPKGENNVQINAAPRMDAEPTFWATTADVGLNQTSASWNMVSPRLPAKRRTTILKASSVSLAWTTQGKARNSMLQTCSPWRLVRRSARTRLGATCSFTSKLKRTAGSKTR